MLSRPFTRLAIFIFGVIAFMHLVRMAMGWEIVFNGIELPIFFSLGVASFTGLMAIMLWREL